MPPDRTPGRSRAPRNPPSCRSCRLKKLKCDRERPCANCRTRRLECEYSNKLSTVSPTENGQSNGNSLQSENDALRSRLARLEKAVFGHDLSSHAPSPSVTSLSPATSIVPQEDARAKVDSEWLEHKFSNRSETVASPFSDMLLVTTQNTHQIVAEASLIHESAIEIPKKEESMAYLDAFEFYGHCSVPIIHVPTTRAIFTDVYDKLSAGYLPEPGCVALILAVCVYANLWQPAKNLTCTSSGSDFQVSTALAKQALTVLQQAQISSHVSLELLQATIILNFCLINLDGMSAHSRLLQASSLTMAREMGLHRIDAPGSKFPRQTQDEIVRVEVGRRVWWHIASSEWLFAQMSGPAEAVYSIHPKHMVVNLPRMITDHDLSTQGPLFERSHDQPFSMLFFHERCKLANICREIVDNCSDSTGVLGASNLPYEKLIALDARFKEALDNLPAPLRLKTASQTTEADHHDAPASLRMLLNVFYHSRRCKLHLPYLLRFKSDSRFNYSRQVCLDSARAVVHARDVFRSEVSLESYMAVFRLGGTLSHIFYAAIVLVMDLCVNSHGDQSALYEAHRVIQSLEEAKASSQVAAGFLQSLMEILRKHQVNLPSAEASNARINGTKVQFGIEHANNQTDTRPLTGTALQGAGFEQVLGDGVGFEDIWNEYLYNGAALDPQSWDAIMNDLEMHIS